MKYRRIFIALIAATALLICAAASAQANYSIAEWEVLRLTNKHRMEHGIAPLSLTDKLQDAVHIRAREITRFFSHTRPNGTKCFTVLAEVGLAYYACGENIAGGYSSAADVVDAWINSPGHNSNMLNPSYQHMGAGNENSHWTQMFLSRKCSVTNLSVTSPNGFTLKKGDSIEKLNATVRYTCPDPQHGESVMPLAQAMCLGYDPNAEGTQTVSVKLRGETCSFNVTVAGDDPTPTPTSTPTPTPTPMPTPTPTPAPVKPGIKVRSITIAGESRLRSGANTQMTVKIKPANAEDKSVRWSSSDDGIISVDESGVITAASGITATATARITAEANDASGARAVKKITVYPAVDGIIIRYKGQQTDKIDIAKKSKQFKLKAETSPKGASQAVNWISANPQIATISKKGKVTLKSAGETRIIAASTDGTEITAEIQLTVR